MHAGAGAAHAEACPLLSLNELGPLSDVCCNTTAFSPLVVSMELSDTAQTYAVLSDGVGTWAKGVDVRTGDSCSGG